MMSVKCMRRASKVFFRLGQILLAWGMICFAVSLGTAYWVIRPTIDFQKQKIKLNEAIVTKNYGIFVACRQSEVHNAISKNNGICGSLFDNLSFNSTARYIQIAMSVAGGLYIVSFSLELVQCLPILRFRNFIAKNRMVEMFAGIATVLVLINMVIFAGEIKNKAERVSGQDDEEVGWSFAVAMIGLGLCILGLILVTIFRELPLSGDGKKGGSWLRPASMNVAANSGIF